MKERPYRIVLDNCPLDISDPEQRADLDKLVREKVAKEIPGATVTGWEIEGMVAYTGYVAFGNLHLEARHHRAQITLRYTEAEGE